METLQDIVSIVNSNKGDMALYRIIFNVLTDNSSLKNYTNNNNGIFFNMNSFDSEKIKSVMDQINSYIDNKKQLADIENNRETIMHELSKTIDNSYKTELQDILDSNKNTKSKLSTHLDIENANVLVSKIEEEKSIKKKNNQRMKKSVEKYQKPMIYKGSYERIKKVLNQSKSTRTSKNNSIEETDTLFQEDSDSAQSVVDNSDIEADGNEDIDIYCEPVYDSDSEVESDSKKGKKDSTEEPEDEMKDLFGSDSE